MTSQKLEIIFVILSIFSILSFFIFSLTKDFTPKKEEKFKCINENNVSLESSGQPISIKFYDNGWIFEVYDLDGIVHLYLVEEKWDVTTAKYIGKKKQEDLK